ncbi:hypothetical protein F2Q68_00035602 [Brassica cretica]|uniref:Uncharacterized protein n=1 Tax=Brassica cretica TaxID=69181 RepID=A0A8S9HCP0_BRACR|nr:hypothetical protein F2Q68_00035602 [Brassica cretica]
MSQGSTTRVETGVEVELGRRELGKMMGEVAATTWLAMESISIALIVNTWQNRINSTSPIVKNGERVCGYQNWLVNCAG